MTTQVPVGYLQSVFYKGNPALWNTFTVDDHMDVLEFIHMTTEWLDIARYQELRGRYEQGEFVGDCVPAEAYTA
jgi:hypothetical protein